MVLTVINNQANHQLRFGIEGYIRAEFWDRVLTVTNNHVEVNALMQHIERGKAHWGATSRTKPQYCSRLLGKHSIPAYKHLG